MRIAVWSVRIEDNHGQGIVTGYVLRNVLMPLGPVARFEFPAGGSVRALLAWLGVSLRLLSGVFLRRHDLIYLVCSRSNFGFVRDIPALVCARLGCRVVVHAHGSDIADLLGRRRISPLAAWLYRRVTLIVSNQALVDACAPYAGQVHLVENYIKQDMPLVARAESDSGFVVYWNSNVMVLKGFIVAAEAVAALHASGADIRFTAIGRVVADAYMTAAEIEARLADYPRQPWFRYLDPVTQDASYQQLGAADAVALILRAEAQPLCLIEAMCVGMALVVSDIPAVRATLGDYPAEVAPADGRQGARSRCLSQPPPPPGAGRAAPVLAASVRREAARDPVCRMTGARGPFPRDGGRGP